MLQDKTMLLVLRRRWRRMNRGGGLTEREHAGRVDSDDDLFPAGVVARVVVLHRRPLLLACGGRWSSSCGLASSGVFRRRHSLHVGTLRLHGEQRPRVGWPRRHPGVGRAVPMVRRRHAMGLLPPVTLLARGEVHHAAVHAQLQRPGREATRLVSDLS